MKGRTITDVEKEISLSLGLSKSKNPLNFSTQVEEAGEYITTSTLHEDMSRTFIKEKKVEGVKFSNDKAPMGKVLKQFPLALEAVAMRSKYGHEKYIDFDQDWMNFKRVPNAKEQYLDAAVRHLAEIGDDEDSIGHLKAAAWNILATLQLKLEKND